MNSDLSAWFIRPKPNPWARLRLYCFPYAGAGVSAFRNWITALPGEIELTIVQLPGRGSRLQEKPYLRMISLIPDLIQVLELDLDRPSAFFGHSLGAIVSYEAARALNSRSINQPIHLFVSGRSAPQIPDPNEPIYHLPDPAFLEKIRQFKGTPGEILENEELVQIFLPILRADFTLNETYLFKPGNKLVCPITVFGGKQDPRVPYDNLSAWGDLTQRGFRLQIFPGEHFFIHSEQGQILESVVLELLDA